MWSCIGHPAVRRTSVASLDFADEWIICFSLLKEKALVGIIGLLIMLIHFYIVFNMCLFIIRYIANC